MKLAWFTHRYFPCVGGAENYGREMVSRFVKNNWRVDVLTSDAHDLWYFTQRDRRRVNAPRESIVQRCARAKISGAACAVSTLFRPRVELCPALADAVSIRVVYAAHPRHRARPRALRRRLRGRFSVHDLFLCGLEAARASGAPLILTPFLHLATPGDPVNRHYTKPHQIRLLAESAAVVVQTHLEADAVAAWGIARSNILVLGMGVDHANVTGGDAMGFRSKHAIPFDAKTIGHLATLDPNKGSTDLVLAVEKLNMSHINEPIILIMAGPSSPEFEGFVRGLSPETKAWLRLLGPLASEDRADFYAAIDIFSMPSRTDSYGIVFLEAWANSKPVVAARAGGVAEVIHDELDGLLVPFGDLDRLSHSLNRLIIDESFSCRLGRSGFNRVSVGHSWDDRFQVLEERVRGLIAPRQLAFTA